ncbi:MAG: peptide ABC transporter ATP-binding protein [Waddliaceae bacterium]|nr:peptide ABC transporter ATP-binding protein [Waddliaceae bacterium]
MYSKRRNRPALSVRNLQVELQIAKEVFPVVNGLSFDLYPGKTTAIVGESGCGKSMSALAIMGILPTPPALPPKGNIFYFNNDLLQLSEGDMQKIRGARIGMIFQDPMSALNPVYTIGYQLIEVAELHLGLFGYAATQKAIQCLEEVGISSPEQRLYDYPHQLSGGMKQRVMIAMALMCEPDVLIADEPTTALDVTIQAQILSLIKNLQKKRNMAVLLITHDMGVVAEMADDVVVMYATQVIEKGPVRQIFDDMAHPYTKGLFDSRPSQHEPKSALHTIEGSVPPITGLPKGCHFHPRCPHAMPVCREQTSPVFTPKLQDHEVKCWLYRQNGKHCSPSKD